MAKKKSSKPARKRQNRTNRNIVSERPDFSLPHFTKEERDLLRRRFGVQEFVVVLNPKYELPNGAKQFFIFIDHEGSEGYHSTKEFLEKDYPGCIAIYYTVSWSEIVIQ